MLQAPDSNYDRIDTVVLRLDDNTNVRTCDLYIVKGIPSANPQAPELTRNSSVYELGLANIFVAKNSTVVPGSRITDTRLDNNRCGYISAIAEFDTTTLFKQIQNDLAEFKATDEAEFEAWRIKNEADWLDWFSHLQDILDEDTAGHLQNEIEALQRELANIKLVHLIVKYDPELAGKNIIVTNGDEKYTVKANASGQSIIDGMGLGIWTLKTVFDDIETVIEINTVFYGNYNVELKLKRKFDYQEWLDSGKITKSFSGLSEILADELTVRQLMTLHSSCDKLIDLYNENPSTFPIVTFANSRIAMKWIGLRDYICDKLLAISDLRTAILSSSYCYDYILFQATNDVPIIDVIGAMSGYGRPLYINVPKMTTKTAPVGEIRVSAEQAGGHDSVQAFNKNYATNNWWSAGGVGNAWISYEFVKPMVIKKFYLKPYNNTTTEGKEITLLGSNSGLDGDWTSLFTHTLAGSGEAKDHWWDITTATEPYKFYKVQIDGNYNGYIAMTEIDFFGVSYSEEEFNGEVISIYDNGVEIFPIVSSGATKNDDDIIITNGQNVISDSIDFTNYNALSGNMVVESSANGTLAITTSASATPTASMNLVLGNDEMLLDSKSVNGAFLVKVASTGAKITLKCSIVK